ncbi:MAG: tetratricopeptide repeat protein, partial [Desulfovibrionaceae bacterium]|nr:tetratricopeptide repeat protein [Desulfovibrionaceae bacterium]
IGEVASRVAALYAEKNPQEAEKFLRRALEAKGAYLSKEDIGTFNRLGILLRNQGKWKEALVEYQKALKVAPDDENLYYNMGMACAEGKEFREAQVYMLKALAINPDLPRTATNIAYNIALVFGQNGDKKRAADCLNIALECDPEFEPARRALERM